MEWGDVYFGLRGAHNLNVHWDISADKLSLFRKPWVKFQQCAGKRPVGACCACPIRRWPNKQEWIKAQLPICFSMDVCWIGQGQPGVEALAEILKKGKMIRLIGKETDLTFSVEGRGWDVADGRMNMPDGEIATAPVCENC